MLLGCHNPFMFNQSTLVLGYLLLYGYDVSGRSYVMRLAGPVSYTHLFITELNHDPYSISFLQEYDCERYYRYNKELLFEESSRAIEARLRALGK